MSAINVHVKPTKEGEEASAVVAVSAGLGDILEFKKEGKKKQW